MSGNSLSASPQEIIAALSAQVSDLQGQLATAQGQAAVANANAATAARDRDTAQAQVASLTTQLTASQAQTAALQAQLDDINAPVEPGINRGPASFVTGDGISFSTLRAAQVHVTRQKYGVNAKTAEMILDGA